MAYGWCSITALGNFNSKIGGLLVLLDLQFAIELPAGSSILIPSAAFTHYNLPIALEESRSSVTQFSAGGIFRWIAYGHQFKRVAESNSVQAHSWWEKGKGLYTIWPRDSSKGADVCQSNRDTVVDEKGA